MRNFYQFKLPTSVYLYTSSIYVQIYRTTRTTQCFAPLQLPAPYFTRRATRNLRKCESRTKSGKLRARGLVERGHKLPKTSGRWRGVRGAGEHPECAPVMGALAALMAPDGDVYT